MRLRRLCSRVLLIAALPGCKYVSAQTPANPFPNGLALCEESGVCAFMAFNGTHGVGHQAGITTSLTVEKADAHSVVIRRIDQSGNTKGLTALYVGTRPEDWVEGTLTSTPPNGGPKKQQKWYGAVQPVPVGDDPSTVPRYDIKKASLFSTKTMMPRNFTVCVNSNDCGKWSFRIGPGVGTWDDGAISKLKVVRYLPDEVVFYRKDEAGIHNGWTGTYMGVLQGGRIEGIFVYLVPGNSNPWVFRWNADVRDPADQPADRKAAMSAPTPAAPPSTPQTTEVSTASSGGSQDEPPSKMKLCMDNGADCVNLTLAGDHYEGHKDGHAGIYSRYWISLWDGGAVEFTGTTAFAVDGIFPAQGSFKGNILARGDSIVGGQAVIRVGYGNPTAKPFTLTWIKGAPSTASSGDYAAFKAPRRSVEHPNILLPPGAAEAFASYPADVRAILQPERPITLAQAKLQCTGNGSPDAPEKQVADPLTAMEIAKFALRAGEFQRGKCWLDYGSSPDNSRARVIEGVLRMMGWAVPKDPAMGFRYFNGEQRARDPWAIYFLEQCYLTGTGTAQNKNMAVQMESWLITHDEGAEIYKEIGSDDAEAMRVYERGVALTNAPTVARKKCEYVSGPEAARDPNVVNGQRCYTTYETDEKALDQRLEQIDNKYPAPQKPQ